MHHDGVKTYLVEGVLGLLLLRVRTRSLALMPQPCELHLLMRGYGPYRLTTTFVEGPHRGVQLLD